MLEDLIGPTIEMREGQTYEVPDAIGEVYVSAEIAVYVIEKEKRQSTSKKFNGERTTKE